MFVIRPFESTVIIGIAVAEPTVPADTPEFASVTTPLSLAVRSPYAEDQMYFLTLDMSERLLVPPPPSSIRISSASTMSAPMSVPPSILTDARSTTTAELNAVALSI